MLSEKGINRRQFIKAVSEAAAVGAGLPYIISSKVLGAGDTPAANDKINVGFIGVGLQGTGLLWQFLRQPQCKVAAICDVDKQKLNQAVEMVKEFYSQNDCSSYGDFRELLNRNDIDAVVIAVPEHWHGVISIEACKKSKDVYCEKPLALSIGEGREVVKAVRQYKKIFQVGTMQRSDYKFRQACEFVRNGFIGQITKVRLFLGTKLGSSSFPIYPVDCDLPAEPVPEALDWDMWLGPAPWRPYNSRIAPPIEDKTWPHWRDYDDYSGGLMTDWGAHHFDIAQWALGMDESGPVEIYPENGKDIKMLTYRYANGVTMVRDDTMPSRMIEFTGTDGTVEVSREFIKVKPESLIRRHAGPKDILLYKSDNHYANWLDCIRTRNKPVCDVETGQRSVTVCHLGIIAKKLDRPLKWAPSAERFVGDDEANKFLNRSLRSPWKLG